MSTQSFVEQLYSKILGRGSDSEGIAFWTKAINDGLTTGVEVTEKFIDSPEFLDTVTPIARLYYASFDRIPDAEGMNFWVSAYQNGHSQEEIARGFVTSTEFVSMYGDSITNDAFIDLLYQNVLGRTPDAEGKTNWLNAMGGGMTREEVLLGFSNSQEFIIATNNAVKIIAIYHAITQTPPTEAQLSAALAANNELILIDQLYKSELYTGESVPGLVTTTSGTTSNAQSEAETPDETTDSGTGTVVTPPATSGNVINGTNGDDRLTGTSGNDDIRAGAGNDTIRGGAGVDKVYAGDGDDRIVIVGDLSGGGKVDSAEDTDVLGVQLTTLNGQDLNEDEDGSAEIIDGGDGNDTLYVYGTADLSNYTITNIEHIEIRSDVAFESDQLIGVRDINGDGSSTIRIVSKTGAPVVIDLATLNLTNIGHIDVGANVTIKVDSLDQLGGAKILTGEGAIFGKQGVDITLPDTYSVEGSLRLKNNDGASDAQGNAQILGSVVSGQTGNIQGTGFADLLIGTDADDTFYPDNGDDIMSGKKGDDRFVIDGTGDKIIIDSNEDNTGNGDTLDLSQGTSGAVIDLNTGGTVGANTSIQLGAGNAEGASGQDAPKSNVMIIIDTSGSMGGSRITEAKNAAIELLDAYKSVGDVAVRIIEFNSNATSSFGGNDTWLDLDTAKGVINALSTGGSTNYSAAMDTAESAFASGKGSVYFTDGKNVSYFLSDGSPNSSVSSKEIAWETFLVNNQITSHAIGFGGILKTSSLEPIAYDGIKAEEIEPTLEADISNLGETLVETVKLDFIENVIGTDFADTLTGNSLNNKIEGGAGDDVLEGQGGDDELFGGEGDNDTAVFSGSLSEYTFTTSTDGLSLIVEDTVADRDGADTLTDVEWMTFAGLGTPEPVSNHLVPKDALWDKYFSGITPKVATIFNSSGNPSNVPSQESYIMPLISTDNTSKDINPWPVENGVIKYFFNKRDDTLSWTDNKAREAVEKALQSYENIINVTFTETAVESDADFNFYLGTKEWMTTTSGNSSTFAFMYGHNKADRGFESGSMVLTESTSWELGKTVYGAIIHELGHGLGLQHPHYDFTDKNDDNIDDGADRFFPGAVDSSSYGTHNLNQGVYTTMSYNLNVEDYAADTPNNKTDNGVTPVTPMALDIATLQMLYGANTTHNSGNNTYDLNETYTDQWFTTDDLATWKSIWDTGGVDEIVMTGTQDVTIDLRAATIDTDNLSQAVTDANIGGYISRINISIYDDTSGGFTIAHGVEIENASGGSGEDKITGNNLDNTLRGKGDKDNLSGLGGNDVLIGGTGNDTLTGGEGADIFQFESPYYEVDTITDFKSGTDKIQFFSSKFGTDVSFIANSDPEAPDNTPVFLFNTSTGVLSFDDGKGYSGILNNYDGYYDIAVLSGVTTLLESDLQKF